jgi:hypothetical protein
MWGALDLLQLQWDIFLVVLLVLVIWIQLDSWVAARRKARRDDFGPLPQRVWHLEACHAIGSTWLASRDLSVIPWHGTDRIGLCGYEPRVAIRRAHPEGDLLPAGTAFRLIETYDADQAREAKGWDLGSFYEAMEWHDILTFEVIDGPLAGRRVQAPLCGSDSPEGAAAAAALLPQA